jgi:hypothetical protein
MTWEKYTELLCRYCLLLPRTAHSWNGVGSRAWGTRCVETCAGSVRGEGVGLAMVEPNRHAVGNGGHSQGIPTAHRPLFYSERRPVMPCGNGFTFDGRVVPNGARAEGTRILLYS